MARLLVALTAGIITCGCVAFTWHLAYAKIHPPDMTMGDCIGEVPVDLQIVGPYQCDGTCPTAGPPDPGKCVFVGNDYEPIWAEVADYENTGDNTWLHYLDADCTALLSDQCWYVSCPDEVLWEMYNDFWYNDIAVDPECPK